MKQNSKPMGHTDESLAMLRSPEGQLNAAFACFGSAAQHAQLFEEALVRFLSAYNRISGHAVSLDDLEAYERSLNKKTMGQLLRELSKYVTIEDSEATTDLDDSLEQRNFLMHRFFLVKMNEFETEEGRLGLIKELLAIESVLDRSRIRLNAMRIAMYRTLEIAEDGQALEKT